MELAGLVTVDCQYNDISNNGLEGDGNCSRAVDGLEAVFLAELRKL